VLASHALGTTTGQADQRPSDWGCFGARSSATRAGWKPTTKSCACGSGRWRGRMPGGAGSTSTRWPWTRRVGCWPSSAPSPPTRRSGRHGAWPPRNWTVTGAPTASCLPHGVRDWVERSRGRTRLLPGAVVRAWLEAL
jgi:hypothetical protein